MNETLQEFVDSRGVAVRVDRDRGIIRGVKILGLRSRNGRTYLPDALAEAAGLYEGVKVNVNHPKGSPVGPRDYQDRIGVIRHVAARPAEGLFADFHFNPKHALAEQLAWDDELSPENVGFSHNVEARTSRHGDRVVVEAITKVQSVDLVADPATTRGLFESVADVVQPSAAERTAEPVSLAGLTVEELSRRRPDLVEAIQRQQAEEIASLRAEIDRLEVTEAVHQRRVAVRRLLGEYGLPDPDTADGWSRSLVSERFIETLLSAPSEEAMREMIQERARLVWRTGPAGFGAVRPDGKPLSRDQSRVHGPGPSDAKTFVKAIT